MTREADPGDGALSAVQIAFLIESGTFTAERLAEVSERVARGDLEARERKTRQDTIDASLSANVVAERLGLDIAELRRLRSTGNLYAFRSRGRWRYPCWQFTDDRRQLLLPHLAFLIASIPVDMHPATVLGFMETPQRSAQVDGRRVTPGEWLLRGGDPQVLRDIFEAFLMN
ncbi:hypothetical protein SAMN06295974_1882 [Plantibacter flavus]|uniref:DNA-binding protein n=1 Tax=Plantibacter flavus TaxID=150123 RepID=A0A3N2BXM2_9MICO|nr:hypothetical protein [Plantibacter flavus]ROR79987.1 hypothetical protein EDD42_0017 [Plantibacter flavus]SMG28252.1 hypothetical protein SAMN06295974_1882 [Plantibacter flavus]